MSDTRLILEEFVIENTDLERLETLSNQFNIFEAMGAVRQELRHSDFLAYLMDPHKPHGLGDSFAKRILLKALRSSGPSISGLSPIELETMNLADLEVVREWQNIDILLRSDLNRMAVVIENKIDSGEHSDQLQRYQNVLRHHFGGWTHLGVFLTPTGDKASDSFFMPLDYMAVVNTVEHLLSTKDLSPSSAVRTSIEQYAQMLRRHIVSDSDIAELCRKIYRKHKAALDLIYEHRPDLQATLKEYIVELLAACEQINIDDCSKSYIRFAPKEWETSLLNAGQGWTSTGRIILYEYQNMVESLKLKLIIGPGPRETREKLFSVAQQIKPLFSPSKKLNNQWNVICSREVLPSISYRSLSEDGLKHIIKEHWERFLRTEFEEIGHALRPLLVSLKDTSSTISKA